MGNHDSEMTGLFEADFTLFVTNPYLASDLACDLQLDEWRISRWVRGTKMNDAPAAWDEMTAALQLWRYGNTWEDMGCALQSSHSGMREKSSDFYLIILDADLVFKDSEMDLARFLEMISDTAKACKRDDGLKWHVVFHVSMENEAVFKRRYSSLLTISEIPRIFKPSSANWEDVQRIRGMERTVCPRRYCWWWRTLGFDWEKTPVEGCDYLERANDLGWIKKSPCRRCDPSAEDDHYEPREPHLMADGFKPYEWIDKPKK